MYNCEVNIIIASNRSEQFNHFITTYDTNFESTEHFISNIISDLNKKKKGEILMKPTLNLNLMHDNLNDFELLQQVSTKILHKKIYKLMLIKNT